MITKTLLLQICLYHLAILACEGWRPYKIEITNVTTFSSADICQMNSSISSTTGSISMFLNVQRFITSFYAKTVIMLESSEGIYDLELINKTFDGCEFIKNPKYEPLSQFFYKQIARASTFPKRCPIAKKLYIIKDLLVNPENLPPTIPLKGGIGETTLMTKSGDSFKEVCGYKMQVKVKRLSK